MSNSFEVLTLSELQDTNGGGTVAGKIAEEVGKAIIRYTVGKLLDCAWENRHEIVEFFTPAKDDPMFDTPYYKIFSQTCPN